MIILKDIFKIFVSALRPVEKLLIKKQVKIDNSRNLPVFIIGAPRTGSTLLYLVIARCWDISYATNFQNYFNKIPVTGALLSKVFTKPIYKSDWLKSYHGTTKGLSRPNEFGQFWYNWFPRDRHYVPNGVLTVVQNEQIYKAVSAMISIGKKPFIFKNMNCGQRIGALSEIFPDAVFLFCRRDPLYTAQSLLLTRESVYKTRNAWWSIMPKEYEDIIKHQPERQVVEQVYYIEKQIEEDLVRYYPNRYCQVHYESLIQDPKRELESIRNYLMEKGVSIKSTENIGDLLIENGNIKKIDDETFNKLISLVEEYFGQNK